MASNQITSQKACENLKPDEKRQKYSFFQITKSRKCRIPAVCETFILTESLSGGEQASPDSDSVRRLDCEYPLDLSKTG